MLTVEEIAARFAVSKAAVLGWIRAGELKAVNVSRGPHSKRPRWRVSAAALAAFEEARTPTPVVRLPRRAKARTEVVEFYK